ncbi:MAG: hypothetical protein IKP54_07375 [Bacteroidales bacterium]|nr:hypothetical protein [Bacteroidales bacterium]
MPNTINDNIQEWLMLSNKGLFVEAKNYYFNNLFDKVINRFVENTKDKNRCDVLFSILGYTPEPIILTQRALLPSAHIIFTTNKNYETENEINSYLEKFLTSSYKIINLEDDSFKTLYENLFAQMNIYPSSKYVIDVTGGKKSMVASAAIFAKDYNCNVVYVDYDEYIPDLRRPMPGTEKLNVVYSACEDLINTIDFSKLSMVLENKNESVLRSFKQDKNNVDISLGLKKRNIQDSFNDCYYHYTKEDLGWLPEGVLIEVQTRRRILLENKKNGQNKSIQREYLFNLFSRCMNSTAHAKKLQKSSNLLDQALYSLLNVLYYEIFEENL